MSQIYRPVQAALWMCGSITSFSAMAVAGRYVSKIHSTFEIMTFRSLVGLVIVLALLLGIMIFNGAGGFQRTEVAVDFDFTQAGLSAPQEGATEAETMRSLETQGLREVVSHFAEQSLGALRQGFRSVQNEAGATGRLRIGALPSVASGLLVRAIKAFGVDHPDTLLQIEEGPHHALIGQLRSGALDLVLGRLGRPETMDGLTFHQLYSEEVVLVCRAGSPAAQVKRFEDLASFRVVYPPKASAIRPLIARMLIAKGVALFLDRIETASAAVGRALVLDDPDMVWFITKGVVAEDIASGRLVALGLDLSATLGAVGIMARAEEVPPPAARSFIRCVTRVNG